MLPQYNNYVMGRTQAKHINFEESNYRIVS